MIYFDNSATTKAEKEIIDTFVTVNEKYWANPASIHEFGHHTNELLQSARAQVAEVLKTTKEKIYFTSGGTESNNLAIFGLVNKYKLRGNHVLISEIEHPSVLEAAKMLQLQGLDVEYIPVNKDGIVSIEDVNLLLRNDTVLVSVMHVNNEIGAIQPINEIASIIKAKSRAVFHMDAVQSFGKTLVNFEEQHVDAITISSHKIHGLKGSGLLALKNTIEIDPILYGGGQEYGIRSGTTPVPLAVCTAKAIRLANSHVEQHAARLKSMTDDIIFFLKTFASIKIISPEIRAPHIVSFAVRGVKGEVIINALQKEDVIVSTSSACSSRQTKTSHVLKAIHIEDDYIKGVVRLSFSYMNTIEEVEHFKKIFTKVISVIKGD
ncbi:cysteine desulfurase family protein [Psychrobacillus vulpis]|uniref:Cysteine desulfurase n=1 Tax=Psychrobacillus vulpis TaxID=2325572 RepID=A0A544TLY2_9BACI|nr:cysteine desulfurase family protein [Psychrobacillus vulpis]TQR18438.1 cysteine desulfurase [Psychrobacillus vulpis]